MSTSDPPQNIHSTDAPSNQIDPNTQIQTIGVFKIPGVENLCCAITILVLNIFLPGWGTMLLACCNTYTGNDFSKEEENTSCIIKCGIILFGILQFISAVCIIGWILSIYTGVLVLQTCLFLRRLKNKPTELKDIRKMNTNNFNMNINNIQI